MLTDDEARTMSELVAETDLAAEISKQLHECLVAEVRRARKSYPDLEIFRLQRND